MDSELTSEEQLIDIDSLFAKMKDAPVFGRGTYMGEGSFEVEIKKLMLKQSFKGVLLIITEFEIVESDNPAHKPGSTGSWAPKIANPNTFGDVKCLLFACMGKNGRDVDPNDTEAHALVTALARAACGSEPAKAELKKHGIDSADEVVIGARVHLETKQTKTKEGNDFTRYTWSPSKAAT